MPSPRRRGGPASAVETPTPATPNAVDQPLDELEQLIALYSDGSHQVRLSRESLDRRGEFGFLTVMPFTAALEDDVKRQFGGGRYRGKVVDGRNAYRAHISFTIEGEPTTPGRTLQFPRSELERDLTVANDRLERMLEKLLEAQTRAAAAPAAQDPMKVAIEIAKLIGDARGATTVAPASEMIKLFREGMDLGRNMRGGGSNGGGKSDALAVLLEHALPPLTRLLENRAAATPAGALPAAAAAAGDPAVATSSAPAIRWEDILAHYKAQLVELADDDSDASTYAVVVLDKVEKKVPAVYAQLEAASRQPGFGDRALGLAPEFTATAERRQWFTEFFAAVIEQLRDDGTSSGSGT